MYKELSKASEARGKVVQSITYSGLSDQVIVAFEDETFIVFGIERGYENDDYIRRKAFDLEGFGGQRLVESGVITKEGYQQRKDFLVLVRQREREAAERRRYEQLKAKYDD